MIHHNNENNSSDIPHDNIWDGISYANLTSLAAGLFGAVGAALLQQRFPSFTDNLTQAVATGFVVCAGLTRTCRDNPDITRRYHLFEPPVGAYGKETITEIGSNFSQALADYWYAQNDHGYHYRTPVPETPLDFLPSVGIEMNAMAALTDGMYDFLSQYVGQENPYNTITLTKRINHTTIQIASVLCGAGFVGFKAFVATHELRDSAPSLLEGLVAWPLALAITGLGAALGAAVGFVASIPLRVATLGVVAAPIAVADAVRLAGRAIHVNRQNALTHG